MTRARKRILIALTLSLVTFLAAFTALKLYSSGQEPVVVSVQPSTSTRQINSFFDIYIVFEDYPSQPLDAFQIYVNFDKSLMEVTGVSPGPVVPGGDISLFHYTQTSTGILIEDLPPNGIPLRARRWV
ncbi:MAG: hypothetical protein ACQXXH_06505 [Candidatus Bathyarchaeia archaeon]|jgi:hypothetical protein|nr:hypothetical protein [Candidatus Bathyarchaeota archaeon A05DMB-4]MDH7595253.1 hypothetical protein [Candidatus Bathyarchaeota archaeon]